MNKPALSLLCEHASDQAVQESFRLACGVCGSFWDLDSRAVKVVYDARYPEERGHFDAYVGALKVRTLQRWLAAGGVSLDGKRVCEVGFGGGTCLPYLAERGRRVIAIETNAAAIARVRRTGLDVDLLLAEQLPARLDESVDLWLFQDSFEHLPEPAAFLRWMCENSAPAAEILVVLPRADSLSRRLLGRYWPHKLPDHEFHWSRPGLIDFFAHRGFDVRAEFFPLKFASPQMVLAHGLHKLGIDGARERLRGLRLAIPLNFGELGLVLRRRVV
jgi:SAM-dependent methyltransferase